MQTLLARSPLWFLAELLMKAKLATGIKLSVDIQDLNFRLLYFPRKGLM